MELSRKEVKKSFRKEKKEEEREKNLFEIDSKISVFWDTEAPLFNVFGSVNGADIDVVYFAKESHLENLQNLQPHEINRMCENVRHNIAEIAGFDVKLVNANVSVAIDEHIVWSGHGQAWETNNAVCLTKDLHTQPCERAVVLKPVVPSDKQINAKIHRAVRSILSMVTRTKYRKIVKQALGKNVPLGERVKGNQSSSFSFWIGFLDRIFGLVDDLMCV